MIQVKTLANIGERPTVSRDVQIRVRLTIAPMVLRAALLIVTLAVSGAAQVPAPPAPPRDQPVTVTGTSTIRGRVTASDTGQPLRNGILSGSRNGARAQRR